MPALLPVSVYGRCGHGAHANNTFDVKLTACYQLYPLSQPDPMIASYPGDLEDKSRNTPVLHPRALTASLPKRLELLPAAPDQL